jgi:hypothetical protein
MMTRSEKTPWVLLLLASSMLLTACSTGQYSTTVQPVEGVITHYETGEPIPDVFVVARWTGTSGGLGHSGGAICFHVEVTKTDGAGRYYIPVPEIRPEYASYRRPRILITAYKPGYREPYWENDVPAPPDRLIKSSEYSIARIDYLGDVLKDTDCRQANGGEKNLLAIRQAIYQEVKSMENYISDKSLISWYLMQVEQLEYGYDSAADRHNERRMQLQ